MVEIQYVIIFGIKVSLYLKIGKIININIQNVLILDINIKVIIVLQMLCKMLYKDKYLIKNIIMILLLKIVRGIL